jgi:type I restriction enzyme M protein
VSGRNFVVAGLTLVCPVRGRLKAKAKSADGLRPSEERLRVDAIRHLVDRGYPKENIWVEAVIKRFGNSGRNSFRADMAVLDVPVSTVSDDPDDLLEHAVLLGEVKRDNANADTAKAFQVRPMLDFATLSDCVALYWDDIEQRVYWYEQRRGRKHPHDGPLADLPGYGNKPHTTKLTLATIDSDKPLLGVFTRIEDILHSASIGPQKRFNVMLQLLLAKLHDEHQNVGKPNKPLVTQDFAALETDPVAAKDAMDDLLQKALKYYQSFLPENVSTKLPITAETLVEVTRVLAPIKVVSMEQRVIQDFYMYFARHIYKWDLAQYFTPTSVTEFIVEVLNPRPFEHVKDPACGSADFLTSAFRRGHAQGWHDYASSIHGSDVSLEATQVAVLNMILNGDGKTNITREDSLLKINSQEESVDVVICNPPFGTKIVERKPATLSNFDLGCEWKPGEKGGITQRGRPLDSQECGILFAEACVRLLRASPQGRFALVVPNGYLGNRSGRYVNLREWLLRHCRIAAIAALPRFAFKSSGADVSASVIFCEKREIPLADARDSEEFDISIEVVDRVGWNLKAKQAEPVFRRDPKDGTRLVDDSGDLILDSDFSDVLARIRSSDAVQDFPWLVQDLEDLPVSSSPGWSISSTDVTTDPHLTLDPKRHCRKFREIRAEIETKAHFRLTDVVTPIPEGFTSSGERSTIDQEKIYRHIEITDVGIGTYRWQKRRGWELPSRAKHHAESGDLYLGSIWSSVTKWCLIGQECPDTVVTNGLHRLRIREEHQDLLLDLVVGLCSEAYATQMRGLARGSDGLAEIPEEDMAEVILPRIEDHAVRAEMQPFVDQLLAGFTSVEAKVSALVQAGQVTIPLPAPRPEHTSII